MSVANGWPAQDRYDRHVRHARICAGSDVPARRLAFVMEEALRLASLPGENEGRRYYFRHLRIARLPPDGDCRIWLEQFQSALSREAERAMYVGDPRAASANAVFFRGEEEALEILLHRVLTRQPAQEWYWLRVMTPSGAGEFEDAPHGNISGAGQIVAIVERLRARPASWLAVAAALFAARAFDVPRLLSAIAPAVAEGWLQEIGGTRPCIERGAIRLSSDANTAIQQAARHFGLHSPRTLWLAAMAVLVNAPTGLASGTLVTRARSALQQLAFEAVEQRPQTAVPIANESSFATDVTVADDRAAPTSSPVPEMALSEETSPLLVSNESKLSSPANRSLDHLAGNALSADASSTISASSRPGVERGAARVTLVASPQDAPDIPPPASTGNVPPELSEAAAFPTQASAGRELHPTSDSRAIAPWLCEGTPTGAAGLFFLLNVLDRLGITSAVESGIPPELLPAVLLRLASHAGIDHGDAIVIWLNSLLTGAADADELLPRAPSCWPANLTPRRDATSFDYMVRAWTVASRRWCWHMSAITAAAIVVRPGVFCVNRTDLDISLPLDEADVRIRRAGLDLDPGWLPWFGRVVRFHYLSRGELAIAGSFHD